MLRFLLVILLLSLPSFAEATALLPETEQSNDVTLDQKNIEDLLSTLEDEEARDAFINTLKTLKEATDKDKDTQNLTLTSKLGLDAKASTIIHYYEDFIKRHDLNAGIVGKSILTGIAIFMALIIGFINRKLFIALRQYLHRVKVKYDLSHDRFRIYARLLRYGGYCLIFVLFIFTLSMIWEVKGASFISLEKIRAATASSFDILTIIFIAVIFWELINSLMEFGLNKITHNQTKRIDTLIPIVRNIMFMTFITLFTLVLLSEIGLNITPLLAGAGIFGIAIGFGAQTMVKDFLAGFTVILEDLIQVGDVVKVADRMGLVEKITIRKVQLRDVSGIVYTIPFSEISIVENWTKDFSFYAMDIGVAYREDTDNVITHLKAIGEELQQDDYFKNLILEPIEILGVDAFADSAVIIKARIKTLPVKQWEVGREFNRRMKYKFDQENIEIPFPHQTIYFGEDKEGKSPPAHIMMNEKNKKVTKK